MNTYIAFWKGKKAEVKADTAYEAQQKAAETFGKRCKRWDVTVMLALLRGVQVNHVADF